MAAAGPDHREQQPERRTPGLAHRALAAGQPERAEARDPRERAVRHAQELAAPDGAVLAVAGAVPRHAEHRAAQLVLGHARRDVRHVVLDLPHRQSRAAGEGGRGIVGVAVGHHHLGRRSAAGAPGWRPRRGTRPATAGDRGRRCAG